MNILLSAHFDQLKNPERIAFLEKVHANLPPGVKLIAFNLSGQATASFQVIMGYDEKPKPFTNARDRLRLRLLSLLGNRAGPLYEHAISELTALGGNPDRHIMGFLRRVERFVEAVEKHRPGYCYLWNQFNAFHNVAEAYLRDRGINVGFFHDGVLPGSIALDFDGEMGGSWVSIRHDELNQIPITDAQLAAARDFLRMVTDKSLSRHKQVEKILVAEAIEAAGLGGRKMIFYAGQNDWHAGIQPDGERRLIHSPLYGSSLEPLHDLDRLARLNDWVVVFKPHPLDRDKYSFLRADEFSNTLILASTDTNVCIDRCDVFMTIASQTCYTAALRGKPVVMLGKNQIVGKGITYDVESREVLQEKILIALQDPLGSSRSVQLARHAAQLERAYLFDFGFLENKFYTRGPREFAQLIAYAMGRHPQQTIQDTLRVSRGEALSTKSVAA